MPRHNINLKSLEKTLFFLTILLLPTQLGKHFWPHFSFIYSLRVDYLSPTIYFWDLLVLGLLWVWAVTGVQKIRPQEYGERPGEKIVNNKFLFLLLFFLLTQSISILAAVNPEGSLVRFKDYLVSGLFGLYISSQKFPRIRNLFFSGLALSTLFTCLLATAQFLLGHSLGFWILGERDFTVMTPLIAKFTFYEDVFLRPYATFPHPNMLAGFLILCFPLIIYGLDKKLNPLKLVLGLLLSTTSFITFSRPGLLLSGIQAVLLFRKFWKILLILGVIVAPLVMVRLISVFTFDSLAVLRRRELSEYAIMLILHFPLAGVGLNNFVNVLASDQVLVGTSRFLQPVHNIFLLILSETGVLGMLGVLGIFGSAIWKNLRDKDKFSKVLLGNLMMIIILGFFDHYFLTLPQGQRLLFLILGLSFSKR